MGSTIWLLSDSTLEQGDTWDHSAMLEALDQLDSICVSLQVRTVSSFMGLPEHSGGLSWKAHRKRASWFDPKTAIQTFEVLRSHISQNPDAISVRRQAFAGVDFREILVEELDDCLSKVRNFAALADPFHLCVVS